MAKKLLRKLKKGLPLLALGLGAAALGRNRRNKAIDKGIEAAEADKGSDMLQSPKAYITKKVENTSPNFQTKFKANIGNNRWVGPNEASGFSDRVTDVVTPNVITASAGNLRGMKRFSKGGRVTGAAKRGFGRALMKGKK